LNEKRDAKNLADLREKLPEWLTEPEAAEEIDEDEAASVGIDVDTTGKVTVGSRG